MGDPACLCTADFATACDYCRAHTGGVCPCHDLTDGQRRDPWDALHKIGVLRGRADATPRELVALVREEIAQRQANADAHREALDGCQRLRRELAEARADSVLLRDRLSALHQDLASERLRYQHEATKHREWSDRWHELVHALVEQQGGSAIVYDLTPAQREAHVGRSIGVRPMPVCGATRYVLEEREASDVR